MFYLFAFTLLSCSVAYQTTAPTGRKYGIAAGISKLSYERKQQSVMPPSLEKNEVKKILGRSPSDYEGEMDIPTPASTSMRGKYGMGSRVVQPPRKNQSLQSSQQRARQNEEESQARNILSRLSTNSNQKSYGIAGRVQKPNLSSRVASVSTSSFQPSSNSRSDIHVVTEKETNNFPPRSSYSSGPSRNSASYSPTLKSYGIAGRVKKFSAPNTISHQSTKEVRREAENLRKSVSVSDLKPHSSFSTTTGRKPARGNYGIAGRVKQSSTPRSNQSMQVTQQRARQDEEQAVVDRIFSQPSYVPPRGQKKGGYGIAGRVKPGSSSTYPTSVQRAASITEPVHDVTTSPYSKSSYTPSPSRVVGQKKNYGIAARIQKSSRPPVRSAYPSRPPASSPPAAPIKSSSDSVNSAPIQSSPAKNYGIAARAQAQSAVSSLKQQVSKVANSVSAVKKEVLKKRPESVEKMTREINKTIFSRAAPKKGPMKQGKRNYGLSGRVQKSEKAVQANRKKTVRRAFNSVKRGTLNLMRKTAALVSFVLPHALVMYWM